MDSTTCWLSNLERKSTDCITWLSWTWTPSPTVAISQVTSSWQRSVRRMTTGLTLGARNHHGYHIFHRVTEENFSKLGTNTMVTYNDIKYDVDFRANNGQIFIFPTTYELNGQHHAYKWYPAFKPGKCELEIMPDWMVNVFSKEPRKITTQRPFGEAATPIEEIDLMCSMVDEKHWDDRDTWVKLGTSMKSANDSEECAHLFDKYSGKSPKYRAGEPLRLWRSFDTTRVSKGTLMYFARKSNPLKYFEHFRNHRNELLDTFLRILSRSRLTT